MPSSKSHSGPSQLHNSESSVIYPKESPTSDTQRDQQRQSSSEIYESLKAIEVFVQSVTAWDLPTPIRLRLSVLDLHLRRAFDNIKHINREEMLDLGRNALIIDEDIQQYSNEQQRRARTGHAASR